MQIIVENKIVSIPTAQIWQSLKFCLFASELKKKVWDWGCILVVDCLPSMCEALALILWIEKLNEKPKQQKAPN